MRVPPPPGANSPNNWQAPPYHLWKINVDVAVGEDSLIRIGAVIRDWLGRISVAATWLLYLSIQPHKAEALAVRSGNRIAHELVQLALSNSNSVWMEEAPTHISNLILFDIMGPIHE
ncbi:hypothetical protein PIB30_081872 [Stylosanthes scabra]|uniref:RNase H type-1 domain-containing protein n=1 Tax=Stylosanthes scabra TaxID=79078 RepID=A0ABU6SSB4_9FABA|nr:hypothetical protein [Stylosanthes scabra]